MGVVGRVASSDCLRRPPNAFLNLNPFEPPSANARWAACGTGGSGRVNDCPICPTEDVEAGAEVPEGGGQCRLPVDDGVDRWNGADESGLTKCDWLEWEGWVACCSVCPEDDGENEVEGRECCDLDAEGT